MAVLEEIHLEHIIVYSVPHNVQLVVDFQTDFSGSSVCALTPWSLLGCSVGICDESQLVDIRNEAIKYLLAMPENVHLANTQSIKLECNTDSFQEPSASTTPLPPAELRCEAHGQYKLWKTPVQCFPNYCALASLEPLDKFPGAYLDIEGATSHVESGNNLRHKERMNVSCATDYAAVPKDAPAELICEYGKYRIQLDTRVQCYQKGTSLWNMSVFILITQCHLFRPMGPMYFASHPSAC